MRLAEAEYDMTQAAFQKPNDADKALLVMFNEEAVQDHNASAQQGRPIYKPQTYIMIMVPGDKDSQVHRRAEQRDFIRFSAQYQAYLMKQKQETAAGTPLSACSFLTSAQIKELEFFNCYTVEQLAEIPDTHARNFRELQSMKKLAKAFLQAAEGMAPITALQEENKRLAQQLESANQAIAELGAWKREMEAKAAK